MRRAIRWVGIGLGTLVAIAAALALFVHLRGIPRYAPGHVQVVVTSTPETVTRGRKLASMLCSGCHLDPATGSFSGRWMTDLLPEFGAAYASNITRDPVHGIGAWSDGELVYLLRTGVTRDGRYMLPWMPKLPHLSDVDLLAVVAFLRSDDPWVMRSERPTLPSRPSFLAKVLASTIFKPLPFPSRGVAEPDRRDPIALGRYLATSLDCYTCHSADFKTLNVLEPERTPGYMGGGNTVPDPGGRPVVSTNLTPDPETGIGRWTQEQFARALRKGIRPDHAPVRPPMRLYPELKSEETAAIHAYLLTLPPTRATRTASRMTPPPPPGAGEGELAYSKYQCGACHGEDGAGTVSLREAGKRYATDAELAERIRNPTRFLRDSQMPPGEGVIAEPDYAPLVVYVRALGAAHRQ